MCIYKISSKRNINKYYIGSSINFNNRKNKHLTNLKNNKHVNAKLQNHANKYGLEDLEFSILEILYDSSLLVIREQFFIDLLLPVFNIRLIAESNLGLKHTVKAKEKISLNNAKYWQYKSRSKETKDKIKLSKTGQLPNKETRLKMSKKLIGNSYAKNSVRTEEFKKSVSLFHKGKFVSKETRDKLSEINIGRKMTEEAKEKMSRAKLGKKLSKESILKRTETRRINKLNKIEKKHVEKAVEYEQ